MYGHLDYSMKSLIIGCKLFLLNDSVLLSVIKARPQNILKWKWQFPLFVAILIKWKFCLKISNASIIFTLRANIISVSLQHLIETVSLTGNSGFVINASNKMLFTLCQFRSALYWYIIAPHIFRTFSIQKQNMFYIFTSAIPWNSFHGGVFPADPLW